MKKTIALLISLLMLSCGLTKKEVKKTALPEQHAALDIDMLKQEVRHNPSNPQAHFQLGLAYAELDSTDLALACYDSAIHYDSSLTRALLEKGTLLIKKNRIIEGYSDYLNVLKSEEGESYVAEITARLGQPYPIHQLTNGDYNNAYGYYSPDGTQIVFQSDRDGNWEIYLMDSEGGQGLNITNNPAQDEMPIFSSNNKVIAFTSTRDDSTHTDRVEMNRNIYLLDIEGNKEASIIETPYDDWYPSFTNKEQEIVFVSEMNDPRQVKFNERWSDVYIKNLKTDAIVRLTQNEADDGAPSLSRNGKWIVFNSNRGGQFQIYRMDKKGNLVEQLTFFNGNCGAPHFSHDGRKITFCGEVDGNYDIYLMRESGNKLMRLTYDAAYDAYPCFSPDNKRIIFHSNRTGYYQLYWIDLMNPLTREELVKQLENKIAPEN